MVKIVVLSGVPSSFREALRNINVGTVVPTSKVFPDGEQYLRIEGVGCERCIVVASLYPNQDSKLVELYLALDALKGLGVPSIDLAILYQAYGRQDKRFLKGEPVSASVLYQLLSRYCDKIVVVDSHSKQALEYLGKNVVNIVPHGYMVKKLGLKVDFVLAPDKGAIERARCLANELGVGFDNLEKFRDRVTGEISVKEKQLDVKGLRVAIVDDIVSTGGTLAKAVEQLYRAGASKVIAIITHALLVGKAVEKLDSVGIDALVTANTIERNVKPRWLTEVDISELVLNQLLR